MGNEKDEMRKLLKDLRKFRRSNKFDRILLFGSCVKGKIKKDSDVDLIIVDGRFKDKDAFERSKGLWIDWHVTQKIKYPVDFVCYTHEEFENMKRKVSLAGEAQREGIEI